MPTTVTPTKAAAEAEAKAITEAKAAAEVRQIHDVDIHYIRQKHSWCRSAPPIDVQGAFIGSPVTFWWVCTNAETQVFTLIDVQGALMGSPVTFRWVRTNADTSPLALKPSHWQPTTPHGQPHLRQINNLIANAWTVNTVWVTALPAHRQPYLQHENLQHGVDRPRVGIGVTVVCAPAMGLLMQRCGLPVTGVECQ